MIRAYVFIEIFYWDSSWLLPSVGLISSLRGCRCRMSVARLRRRRILDLQLLPPTRDPSRDEDSVDNKFLPGEEDLLHTQWDGGDEEEHAYRPMLRLFVQLCSGEIRLPPQPRGEPQDENGLAHLPQDPLLEGPQRLA
jgi:hypothetical protein